MSDMGEKAEPMEVDKAAAVSDEKEAPTASPISVLVWNAQDWKFKGSESAVSKARGAVLTGLLVDYEPDLVVLLEVGLASSPNENVAPHVAKSKLKYTKPVSLGRDDMTTDHDKAVLFFHKSTLPVTDVRTLPVGQGERRPTLLITLEKPAISLAFLHAIANKHASAPQIVSDLLPQICRNFRNLSLFAGDLNHTPPPAVAVKATARAVTVKPWKVVNTGTDTHYSSKTGETSELDWGYWMPGVTPDWGWSAARLDVTSSGLHTWKGSDPDDGVSDHAAILYWYNAS